MPFFSDFFRPASSSPVIGARSSRRSLPLQLMDIVARGCSLACKSRKGLSTNFDNAFTAVLPEGIRSWCARECAIRAGCGAQLFARGPRFMRRAHTIHYMCWLMQREDAAARHRGRSFRSMTLAILEELINRSQSRKNSPFCKYLAGCSADFQLASTFRRFINFFAA